MNTNYIEELNEGQRAAVLWLSFGFTESNITHSQAS